MTNKYIDTFRLQDFYIAGLICLSGFVGVFLSLLLDKSIHSTYATVAMFGVISVTCLYSKRYLEVIGKILESVYILLAVFGIFYCLEGLILPVGILAIMRNGFLLLFPWFVIVIWTINSIFVSLKIQQDIELRAMNQKAIEEDERSLSELRERMPWFNGDHPFKMLNA